MTNIYKILIAVIFFFCSSNYLYAELGQATVYKVTMEKVELCKSSSGVDSCEGAVILAETDQTIDIASVDAGAAAASYGDVALLPLGETYTHMRVTISRKFTIQADIDVSGIATPCRTYAETSGYPGGHAAAGNEIHTHRPAMNPNQTLADMNVYLLNDQAVICTAANCASTTAAQTITYSQGSGSSTHQTQHANGSTDTSHVLVYTLTSPYTVAMIAPTIDISFGTNNAVKATEIGETNLCNFDAQEPIVNITIN